MLQKYFKIGNIIYPPYDYYDCDTSDYNGCYYWRGGNICYYKNGKLYREEWYQNGKRYDIVI